MLKRGPERQSRHLRSQDLQGFGGIPALAHRSMRFMTLLFLAALAGALVCAYDPEAASAPGSGNPSHEASAAQKENAGEDPGLARQAPKPRKQRASLLEKGLEGAKNTLGGLGTLGKDAVEDLESVGKGAVHDVKDVLDSVL
ncbi:dermcidin [Rhinopithecus roxellana]|nr:dermcidin [Rhinopithecus roxellana]XP_017706416.1 PREDICTED: dermcidin [Rhinopithecus bieti]